MVAARIAAMALSMCLVAPVASFAQSVVWPPIADPPTSVRTPGRFVWADLVTNDVGAAAQFYGKVFGWTFETYGPLDDDLRTYTRVLANGRAIGGMVFGGDAAKSLTGGRWVGLVSTGDVGATAEGVKRAGGTVMAGPRTLGERGEVALFRDVTGAVFGAIRSASGDPEDYIAVGEWLWVELWTPEPQRAADFYRGVFGYATTPGSTERAIALTKDGIARAGILRKPDKLPAASAWIPYVRVVDVDETVKRVKDAGGRVLIDPTRYRGTRAALLVDPVGAPFAVAEWKR